MITSNMKDQIQPNAVCNENRGFYKDNHFKAPLQQQLKYHEKTEADNIDHKQFFKKEPKLSPQSLETISTSTREDSTEISPELTLVTDHCKLHLTPSISILSKCSLALRNRTIITSNAFSTITLEIAKDSDISPQIKLASTLRIQALAREEMLVRKTTAW